jgi:hypothetical protein
MKTSLRRAVVAFAALGALAMASLPATATTTPSSNLSTSVCDPRNNDLTGSPSSVNPYFPLSSALDAVLSGPDTGGQHGLVVHFGVPLNPTGNPFVSLDVNPSFYGGSFTTGVLEEFEWLDANNDGIWQSTETPVEDSYNYFAQRTDDKTVCYFGELVYSIDSDGQLSYDPSGSWRADTFGNAPGIFMPGSPKSGMHYQEESAPNAQDFASIVGVGSVTLQNGLTFPNAIRIKETSAIDPSNSKEYKVYSPTGAIQPVGQSLNGIVIDDTLQRCLAGTTTGLGRCSATAAAAATRHR